MKTNDILLCRAYVEHSDRNFRSLSSEGWRWQGQSSTMMCKYHFFIHPNGNRLTIKYKGNHVSFIKNGVLIKEETLCKQDALM